MKETEKNYDVTNWTEYYSKPKSKFSTVTQKITLKKLCYYFEKYSRRNCDIIELGGGNSCFAINLLNNSQLEIKSYSIVDNCKVAVDKFKRMRLPGEAYVADLTADNALNEINNLYDVVYSVGLVEHFRGENIEKIILNHYRLCNTGGMVLITVPTPTIQYRLIRKCMEILNVWVFPDEKPIQYRDISDIINKYGEVVDVKINRKLPLTQLIIVTLKR